MAFNFNNESETAIVDGPEQNGTAPDGGQRTEPAAETPAAAESPAYARFRSCRWHQPKENGNAEFCTHREVKPYAGTTGFDPDAWCPDCQYYKLRRSPKKKPAGDDFTY